MSVARPGRDAPVRHVLVTGGTRGIGAAVARAAVTRGALSPEASYLTATTITVAGGQ